MRASDADRDRYAVVLQEAYAQGRLTRVEYDERLDAVLNAKTYSELEPLVADLPAENLPVPRPPHAAVPVASPGPPMVAVFSTVERKGVWSLPEDNNAVAVFGTVELDLRQAQLQARDTVIRAYAIFGSVEVVVPPAMTVLVDGVGVFGDFKRAGEQAAPVADAPVVRVSGLALFGSVAVKVKN